MTNKLSRLKIEKRLFNALLEAIHSRNPRRISKEAYELKTFLANNSPCFSSSIKILEYLDKSNFTDTTDSSSLEDMAFDKKFNLGERIDVLSNSKEDFCIALFTYNSISRSRRVLESLKRSDALKDVEVFMDGPHAIPEQVEKVGKNKSQIEKYNPKRINSRAGNYGFRRIMIESLLDLSTRYKKFIILEDDCFPTANAISLFKKELNDYENNKDVLTVYGSHFLCDGEFPLCPRFQGWGWATWSDKIIPFVHKMMRLYLLPEKDYLDFIKSTLTPQIKSKIDNLTFPRSCSHTTTKFFAWDETLTHLSALENKYHRPTPQRCIYNFGMDKNSSHFPITGEEVFRKPPFNLITPQEVWKYF